jgi:hypothetical protein
MPDGFEMLAASRTARKGNRFDGKKEFQISYSIRDVVFGDKFAFVVAMEVTRETDLADSNVVIHNSFDFFVLPRDRSNWKVFRYVINNVRWNTIRK